MYIVGMLSLISDITLRHLALVYDEHHADVLRQGEEIHRDAPAIKVVVLADDALYSHQATDRTVAGILPEYQRTFPTSSARASNA